MLVLRRSVEVIAGSRLDEANISARPNTTKDPSETVEAVILASYERQLATIREQLSIRTIGFDSRQVGLSNRQRNRGAWSPHLSGR